MRKNEPWRIVAALISAVYIVYMWSEKDVLAIYSSMPQEEAIPLIVTTVLVSVLKVAGLAALVLLIKWLLKKFKSG